MDPDPNRSFGLADSWSHCAGPPSRRKFTKLGETPWSGMLRNGKRFAKHQDCELRTLDAVLEAATCPPRLKLSHQREATRPGNPGPAEDHFVIVHSGHATTPACISQCTYFLRAETGHPPGGGTLFAPGFPGRHSEAWPSPGELFGNERRGTP
jgi:hypothetical protein